MNAGLIVKRFPIVKTLDVGKTIVVKFYGTLYKILRDGVGPYDFSATELDEHE